jgi:hypothetical protein
MIAKKVTAKKAPAKRVTTAKKKPERARTSLEIALERAETMEANAIETPDVPHTPPPEQPSPIEPQGKMEWPMPVYPLVAKFDVQVVDLDVLKKETAIVIAVYTGSGAVFGLVSREGAIALASRIKKAANSMISGPVY